MNMKKTDFNRYNTFTANVADGLEQDEAKKLSKSASKMHKAEKARDWLKDQEAELAMLMSNTNENLLETFEATDKIFDRAKAAKLTAKSDLHQVFVLPHEDYVMAA